jgi:hypothetical protein
MHIWFNLCSHVIMCFGIVFAHIHKYVPCWLYVLSCYVYAFVALLCLFRPIFGYVTWLKCRCVTILMRLFWFVILHSMFVMIFGIRHWYILAYLCMYLYWLGNYIIKCISTNVSARCDLLIKKLLGLVTSNVLSSSFWYCQRGRDLDAQAKDE